MTDRVEAPTADASLIAIAKAFVALPGVFLTEDIAIELLRNNERLRDRVAALVATAKAEGQS